jgi:lysozyme family protein
MMDCKKLSPLLDISKVIAFQKSAGLKQDGIVGQNTMNALNKRIIPKGIPSNNTKDIIKAYGKPGDTKMLSRCIVPFDLRIAWNKNQKIKSFSCNKNVKDSLEKCYKEIYRQHTKEEIMDLGLDLFGGCVNYRKMRGGSSLSLHSWGIAIDINPSLFAFRSKTASRVMNSNKYKKFRNIMESEGWHNLSYDRMHWELVRH